VILEPAHACQLITHLHRQSFRLGLTPAQVLESVKGLCFSGGLVSALNIVQVLKPDSWRFQNWRVFMTPSKAMLHNPLGLLDANDASVNHT